ncbi:MAG TPA: undecaprenyl-diphosphate phosphatase [Actinomycetota bacterium]
MNVLVALLLGIVQGLTEFLPISSSGHLVVVPFILGLDEPTLAFGVAVHLGTLIAVVLFFREDIRMLVRTVARWKEADAGSRTLAVAIGVGTVPAALIGVAFNSFFESSFERPGVASLLLGVTGWFLMATETKRERVVAGAREDHAPQFRDLAEIAVTDAAIIGAAQAVAILPGISRSGATIGAGMRLGFDRHAAARFSFLLSAPIILGATLVEIPAMIDQGVGGDGVAFLVGIVSAAVSGFVAIRWFLGLVERRTLRSFGAYLLLIMVAGLITALARG